MSFHDRDGFLYCEDLRVKDIQGQVPESPFYLYSLDRITRNYQSYTRALDGMSAIVAFAVKANSNLFIINRLREMGSGAVLVSENELRLAAEAGFDPKRTIYNGNGKTLSELRLAAERGVMINIDSEFDLHHIEQAAKETGKTVDVLIRINPDISPDVHPYVSTGIRNSKFGVPAERTPRFLERIRSASSLRLVGVQCHLGSTIADVAVFAEAARLMMKLVEEIRLEGFDLKFLSIGGGLGIDYDRREGAPQGDRLVDAVRNIVADDITLIVEPGRSIVADAGIMVCRVLGVKANGDKRFVVVDASMSELIRPSLYDAKHHIGFIEPVDGTAETYDVVGPVCESADFLGKDRRLATPEEGVGLVVYDTGAYGYTMSSNYNARMRPPEYLVSGGTLRRVRRAESFDDYMRLFEESE
jgi:diaminopimelate decarboxylase